MPSPSEPESIPSRRRRRWWRPVAPATLIALAGAALLAASAGSDPPAVPPPASSDPAAATAAAPPPAGGAILERVVAVGASVTHGFNAQILVEAGGRMQPAVLDLGDALAAVLPGAGDAAAFGSLFFFRAPDRWARELLGQATEAEPTAVVAIDFLFWFGYGRTGHRPGTAEDLAVREARLDRGVAMLEPVLDAGTPVVVADLPDMSAAAGWMLSAAQVPSAEHRAALNRRIRAWVAERPAATVVPLADLMRRMQAGERFGVPDAVPLLKPDRLHPTADGLLVVARAVGEAIRAATAELADEAFELRHEPAVARLRARLAERLERAATATPEPSADAASGDADADPGAGDAPPVTGGGTGGGPGGGG